MAKKPVRVFMKTKGRMVPVDPAKVSTANQAGRGVPVYKDGGDDDRRSITQRVVEHSAISQARMEAGPSKYDSLFHSIYDAVLLADMDGNVFEANARAEYSFMLSREDLYELNIVDLISGADEKLLDMIRENVDNRRYTVLEAVCLRADETRFFAEIVVNKLRGKNQKSLIVFVRDVTDRKQAEEELRHANDKLIEAEKVQARLDTLSTLFYALNNPLQILMCMAELDNNKEYKKQVARILDVINQLRKEGSLEAIMDESGGTRYEIQEARERVPADASRLLIVDDERMLRDMFVKSLTVAFPQLTLDSAADGRQARDLFAEHHHGMIIMDLSMPVMNGEEAFDEIRQICEQKGWELPPVVFCTGFVVSENLQQVVGDQSYHSCLTKPLEIAEMIRVVQNRLIQAPAGKA